MLPVKRAAIESAVRGRIQRQRIVQARQSEGMADVLGV